MQGRGVGGLKLALLATAAAAALSLAACSPGADYPSSYPSIFQTSHDVPPPRNDTTMNADQVQQATEALITERNHLSAEMQSSGPDKTAAPAPTASAPRKAAGTAKAAPAAANTPGAATAGADATQTAGAETKP